MEWRSFPRVEQKTTGESSANQAWRCAVDAPPVDRPRCQPEEAVSAPKSCCIEGIRWQRGGLRAKDCAKPGSGEKSSTAQWRLPQAARGRRATGNGRPLQASQTGRRARPPRVAGDHRERSRTAPGMEGPIPHSGLRQLDTGFPPHESRDGPAGNDSPRGIRFRWLATWQRHGRWGFAVEPDALSEANGFLIVCDRCGHYDSDWHVRVCTFRDARWMAPKRVGSRRFPALVVGAMGAAGKRSLCWRIRCGCRPVNPDNGSDPQ